MALQALGSTEERTTDPERELGNGVLREEVKEEVREAGLFLATQQLSLC